MTQHDILMMARKSGGLDITSFGWTSWVGTQTTDFLERFADLVARAEREACARECEIQALDGVFAPDDLADAIRARGEK